jgi:LemA protein
MLIYIIAVVVLLAVIVVGMYNGLVRQRNKVDEAWGNIQVQLKRRFDLIPNLVETVKGYATHEKETFERLVQARNSALQVPTDDVSAQGTAQSMVSSALRSVLAVVENYPELKANANFQQLMSSLSEVEDNLQMSRRYYQATVRDFNNKCETFPSMVIAGLFNFQRRPFFELENPEEAENIQVKF